MERERKSIERRMNEVFMGELRAEMGRLSVDKTELARRVGVGQPQMNKWLTATAENGQSVMSVQMFVACCDALHIDPAALFGRCVEVCRAMRILPAAPDIGVPSAVTLDARARDYIANKEVRTPAAPTSTGTGRTGR